MAFICVVEGDYFGLPNSNDRKREKFAYRVTVKVPSTDGALSLIKNKLLDKTLRRNYDNYYAYRTHQLVSITNVDGSKVQGLQDPRLMDFNDLAEYVRNKRLPLKLELYTDLDYFRTMVHLAETNQREFLIKQANLAQDYEEDKVLAELNPEVLSGKSTVPADSNPHDISSQGSKPSQTIQTRQIEKTTVEAPVDPVNKTVITQAENKGVTDSDTKEVAMHKTVEAEHNSLVTEQKPETQKVEKVFVKGVGFVDANKFRENFDREDEKEYENFDTANVSKDAKESSEEVAQKVVDLQNELYPEGDQGKDLVGEL